MALDKEEKKVRMVKATIPVDLRQQTLQEAIHKFYVEFNRICDTCSEWPEFCSCEPCCCPEGIEDV